MVLFREINELGGEAHLEIIIRVYVILTIAAKDLISINLERASLHPGPLMWPLAVTDTGSSLQSEAIRHGG